MFCRPPPLRSFLGTRNEVVKIKHYNRKKTDKRETSWSFHYKRCPGVELGTILPGTNPARRSAGKSGFPADPTGSGREITVFCLSHGVRSGNRGPLPFPRGHAGKWGPPASPTVSATNTPSSPADRIRNFFISHKKLMQIHACSPNR